MNKEEFDEVYSRISKQIKQDLNDNLHSEIMKQLNAVANENGKIDLDSQLIALTTFSLTTAMKFTDKLMYTVLREIFVNNPQSFSKDLW